MTPRGLISPTHKAIRKYYEDLHALQGQRVLNEMGLKAPFQRLLEDTARLKKMDADCGVIGKDKRRAGTAGRDAQGREQPAARILGQRSKWLTGIGDERWKNLQLL